MKVILIKDVARIGRKGDVKDVPDGHAINFLIPRKLAIIATPEGMKRLSAHVSKVEEKKEMNHKLFAETLHILEATPVVYSVTANEKGHLFKGINAHDVAKHLQEMGQSIDEATIKLEHPIKEVGVHEIPLCFDGKKGVFHLEVVKK